MGLVCLGNYFGRLTSLTEGEKGLNYWLDSFADDFSWVS